MFLRSWSEDINNYFRLVTESICKIDEIEEGLSREKTINTFKRYFASKIIKDISKNTGNDLQIFNIKKQNYIYNIINKYRNRFHLKKEPFINLTSFLKSVSPEEVK